MRDKAKFVLPLAWLTSVCLAGPALRAADPLPFSPGEKFSYKLIEGTARPGETAVSDARGSGFVRGLPNHQTVLVKPIEACGSGRCLGLEIDREIPPFVPQLKDKRFEEQIQVKVDLATGDIEALDTTLKMGSSVSNSRESQFTRGVTVGEFYGPWMLDLKDGYRQTFLRASQENVIEVVGREKLGGRECFIVKSSKKINGAAHLTTYWVGVKQRFAVKIEGGGRTLSLEK